ncbi:hypothetical protein CU097_008364 [Rhizopus azygosporus]|uniref:Monopolin complex subunit Csm1/Pcs1 C-terminal domain-containing protein n=1 Tax=Rhizopus azygosporus TaxID=86630 RepID=A0A367JPP1_RHIAZ|nr:hypothetical protein CU097_008364 [Rhizopus azygosporus]
MNPFSDHNPYDKPKSKLAHLNLTRTDKKRAPQDAFLTGDVTKRVKQELYNDDLAYNSYSQPMASSFPYRHTRETNPPGNNFYSQPITTADNRYFDHIPTRGSIEEENNRLREQNGILRSRLAALMENVEELSNLKQLDEQEEAAMKKEQIIQEINKSSDLLNEKMQKLEEMIGKLVEEDSDTPIKSDSKEISELKSKLKRLQKQQVEIIEKEKKFKQENKILKELTGLTIKETRTKQDGVQYVYNLSGPNGSLDFSLFIPNQEDKQVLYSPMLERQRNTSILSHLPDFLRFDIEFNRDQLSRFFWRLSAALYEQEANEENREQASINM